MTDNLPGKTGGGLSRTKQIYLAHALGSAITLLTIAWSLNMPRYFGVALYPQQFVAAIVALALPLAYLTLPAKRGIDRNSVPWIDCIAAVLAFFATGYIAYNYPDVVNIIFSKPASAWLPGLIAIVLLLEALRRATGWVLVCIILVFLAYGLFGDIVPGRLQGRAQDWQMLSGYMAYDLNGIFGIPVTIAATVIVTFILFGQLLNSTGGSNFFTDAAMLLLGRFRGGSMKIAVLASGLFGSISGSAVANVVATGVVTIPLIKRDGYPAHKAAAIEAVASTGGQLMPPVMGAAAFLMAEYLQIPYSQVVLAALVPALLYYFALFIQADLEAARLGITAIAAKFMPERSMVLSGVHFLLPFAILIYVLFFLHWQPEKAALAAAASVVVSALLFGYNNSRPSIVTLLKTISRTGQSMVEIILISAAAGLVIGILNITGLSFNLTYALVQLGGGNVVLLLLLSAAVCILLGMGLPTLGVYVLLATLVAPALIEVGIEPIAAHLYVLYFGMMSMITPPIAIAAFAAASVAQAPAMATGLAAVRFGWLAYIIPVLFVFSPTLLLIGAPGDIALAIFTAVVGVWLVSAALAGYFLSRLNLLKRILFAFFGFCALIPAGMFDGGIYTDLLGVIGGLLLIASDIYLSKRIADYQPK